MVDTTEDEIAKLRAAAAKAREEANALSKELGKEIVDDSAGKASKGPIVKERTASEVLSLISDVNFGDGDATFQNEKLDSLVESGDISLWKSAAKSTSTALRTFPVTLNFLEMRSDGKLTGESLGVTNSDKDVNLNDFKDATLIVTGVSTVAGVASLAFLPENIGATFCYFFAVIPILFLGIGSTAPGLIAGAIVSTRGGSEDEATMQERVCCHEAAHFLCGYLSGLPVKSYEINDLGYPCVEFHPSSENTAINGQREFTNEEIAALTVVAMSGSVAEAIKFGQAKGGENDLLLLDSFLRRSKEFIGAAKQQDLTRWGALASYNILKENMGKYEKLVDAFKQKKSVAQCISVIEGSK